MMKKSLPSIARGEQDVAGLDARRVRPSWRNRAHLVVVQPGKRAVAVGVSGSPAPIGPRPPRS